MSTIEILSDNSIYIARIYLRWMWGISGANTNML